MQVAVGRVGRAHGLRGEVSVEVRTDSADTRFAAGSVLQTDPAAAGPLTVGTARAHGGRLLLSFREVRDRSQAEALRGVLLLVDVDPEERLDDPDEFFDHQIEGLAVHTVGGEPVGQVAEVLHLPGQDLLAVRRPDGTEALVPFVAEIVPTVDVVARRLVVDPPPGLLDLDSTP